MSTPPKSEAVPPSTPAIHRRSPGSRPRRRRNPARRRPCPRARSAGRARLRRSVHTLNQALRDALQRDPRIRAAGSRVQEAGEEVAEARSMRFPTVNLTGGRGYGYNRNEARSLGIYEGDSRTSGLEVNQTIYSFGRDRRARARGQRQGWRPPGSTPTKPGSP